MAKRLFKKFKDTDEILENILKNKALCSFLTLKLVNNVAKISVHNNNAILQEITILKEVLFSKLKEEIENLENIEIESVKFSKKIEKKEKSMQDYLKEFQKIAKEKYKNEEDEYVKNMLSYFYYNQLIREKENEDKISKICKICKSQFYAVSENENICLFCFLEKEKVQKEKIKEKILKEKNYTKEYAVNIDKFLESSYNLAKIELLDKINEKILDEIINKKRKDLSKLDDEITNYCILDTQTDYKPVIDICKNNLIKKYEKYIQKEDK